MRRSVETGANPVTNLVEKSLNYRALHSKLFSEIRVEFRVGTCFLQVEMRRVVRHFFVTFENFGKTLLPKLAKTKIMKKRNFSR